MTETDATKRPLEMPERFIPYLEKHRIYKLFKDMIRELVLNLPRDHLKYMKLFLGRHAHGYQDTDRVIILVSPEINIACVNRHPLEIASKSGDKNRWGLNSAVPRPKDIKRIVKDLIKDLGFFVITRRCILDRYEKHDEFVPGCISPVLMSAVTKNLVVKDPVLQAGWLMFDHPCTVREARCLQQDGVLPTVTLVLSPPPAQAPPAHDARTPGRSFFQQDFEGLKFAYKATVKEVYIDPEEEPYAISTKCFNAIRASASGAQGARQGHLVVGAPGVYRVLIVGPRGSGRSTQAVALAKHFGLVYLNYDDLYNEAVMRTDEIAKRLREYGPSVQIKAEIVRRRLLKKDCIDNGWVLVGYPTSGVDFENLDKMTTPPNRVIFLNAESGTCRARVLARRVDACTGRAVPADAPRARRHPRDDERQIDDDLDNYFSECLAELRAAAGITAVEIDAQESVDQVQVKVQAAVIAAPSFNIEYCSQLRNVRGE